MLTLPDSKVIINNLLDIIAQQAVTVTHNSLSHPLSLDTLLNLLCILNLHKPSAATAEAITRAYSPVTPLAVVVCPTYSQRFITPFKDVSDLERIYIENGLHYLFKDSPESYTPVVKESTVSANICVDIQTLTGYINNKDFYNAAMMIADPHLSPIGIAFPINSSLSGFTVNKMDNIQPTSFDIGLGAIWDQPEITLYTL